MEAAAIGFVAERIGVPSLIAKAVSDFADHDKDDGFRTFACRASATFLLAFFLQQELDEIPLLDAVFSRAMGRVWQWLSSRCSGRTRTASR